MYQACICIYYKTVALVVNSVVYVRFFILKKANLN